MFAVFTRRGVPCGKAVALPRPELAAAHECMTREVRCGRTHSDPAVEEKGRVRAHPQRLGDVVVRQNDRGAFPCQPLKEIA